MNMCGNCHYWKGLDVYENECEKKGETTKSRETCELWYSRIMAMIDEDNRIAKLLEEISFE